MTKIIALIALVVLAFPISTKAEDSYKTYDLQQTYNTQQQAKYDELQWSYQLVAYAKTLEGKRTGQCVLTLRNYFGIPRSEVQGLAKSVIPNTQNAKIGSVIILNMSKYGHVGIVIALEADNIVYFDGNGNWTQRGAIRRINKNDKRIRGYRIIQNYI